MAGTQINDYGVGDTNLTSLMNTADTQRIGYHSVSLTNYATTTVPAVAEGSVVEIAGALFEFQADEAISGSPANGTVYIKLTPSGTSVTAAFSTVAPSWDDEKQGWYEAASNNRYLNFGMVKSGASYTKYQLIAQGTLEVKAWASGNVSCDDLVKTKNVLCSVIGTSTIAAATTATKLGLTTSVLDTHSGLDLGNNKFVVPVAGYYYISVNCTVFLAAAQQSSVMIYVNGVQVSIMLISLNNTQICVSSAVIKLLAATNYIEVFGYQTNATITTYTLDLNAIRIT